MKKLLTFILAFVVISQSCKQVNKLTQFTMNYDTNITIPSTLGINLPINVWTPNITTNSDSEFALNKTKKELIQHIKVNTLKLEITSPESSTFDFLKNIEINISADGLPDKKIAWLDDIPKTGLKKLNLQVSNDDLQEYVKKDSFKLNTKTVTRELISHDTDVAIHTNFWVDAKILGI